MEGEAAGILGVARNSWSCVGPRIRGGNLEGGGGGAAGILGVARNSWSCVGPRIRGGKI